MCTFVQTNDARLCAEKRLRVHPCAMRTSDVHRCASDVQFCVWKQRSCDSHLCEERCFRMNDAHLCADERIYVHLCADILDRGVLRRSEWSQERTSWSSN